jgi:hypothetical protein
MLSEWPDTSMGQLMEGELTVEVSALLGLGVDAVSVHTGHICLVTTIYTAG